MSEIQHIELTTDPGRKAMLERKLENYADRLARKPGNADLLSKQFVLTELLANGVVDVEALRLQLRDSSWYVEHDFDNAIEVINAYNCDDELATATLRGGSGLR